MDWVMNHVDELLELLGGIYVVARIIVLLTPSKKDDAALGNIGKLVKLLGGKVVGLDMKQGVQSKES